MNRNKRKEIIDIAKLIGTVKDDKDIIKLFCDIFTDTEIETLSMRWQILEMLSSGATQREISKKLHVSLCKVTRGAKLLKNKNSVITKHFVKG